VCTEAGSVLRAVAVDFFFSCCYLEIPSESRIRHVPKPSTGNVPEFLCWKWKPYPRVVPVSPNWFEYGFTDEKFCCLL
jgi:hypothetical protein